MIFENSQSSRAAVNEQFGVLHALWQSFIADDKKIEFELGCQYL